VCGGASAIIAANAKAKQYGCRKPLVREKQGIRSLGKRPVVYHLLINSIASRSVKPHIPKIELKPCTAVQEFSTRRTHTRASLTNTHCHRWASVENKYTYAVIHSMPL